MSCPKCKTTEEQSTYAQNKTFCQNCWCIYPKPAQQKKED